MQEVFGPGVGNNQTSSEELIKDAIVQAYVWTARNKVIFKGHVLIPFMSRMKFIVLSFRGSVIEVRARKSSSG